MTLTDRLRRLIETLPLGGSVVLTRDALLELLAEDNAPAVDLTAPQAAALLGLSASALRRLLEAGELCGYKRPGGSTWYVPPAAVAEFRAARQQPPALRAVPVRRRREPGVAMNSGEREADR